MFLPSFVDLEHSEKYILSMRIAPKGFMFSISDPINVRNYCLRETSFAVESSLTENIKRIVFELNFLTQQFKQTNVVVVSTQYDLVPNEYFDNKEKNEYYGLIHSSHNDPKHVLLRENVSQQNTTLFGLEEEVYEFLSRSLFEAHFYHHTNLLTTLFESKIRNTETKKMFVNFHAPFLDIFVFDGMRLEHCLSYEDEAINNQLFYILKIWEQCGLDQLHDRLYVAGNADKELLYTIQQYISTIEIVNTPSEVYLWNEEAQKAPFDLITLSLP